MPERTPHVPAAADREARLYESAPERRIGSSLSAVPSAESSLSTVRRYTVRDEPSAHDGQAIPGIRASAQFHPPKPILIIDDCTVTRESLVIALSANGFHESRVAWDLPSLVLALENSDLGVALLSMATRGSQLLLRAAIDISPNLRVIALGASEDDEPAIVACAEAGVAGYHMRADPLNELVVLINDVAVGMSSCPPEISAMLLRRLCTLASQPQQSDRVLALTAREVQILSMLELGWSNRVIAAQLGIAIHTVKNHVHSLLTKLGVGTREEAAATSRANRSDRGSAP